MARRFCVFIALLAWTVCSMAADAPSLQVQNAWVRQVPGLDVAAAYLTLHNAGAQPLTIVRITSPEATGAMIHETTLVGGVSQMRPEPSVLVPPGQSVTLAPGGRHVMLTGVKPLQVGQHVHLVLQLADGKAVQADALVRPLSAP